MLLTHPPLLAECGSQDAATVYSRCRVGAPDEAFQTLGLWAQLHPDDAPALAVDYYLANRRVYRELSRKMTSQDPALLDQFERDYLVLPDGGCVLPVAYTLAYGYWVQGNILPWIERLEARLADESLTGNRRVNWLLALRPGRRDPARPTARALPDGGVPLGRPRVDRGSHAGGRERRGAAYARFGSWPRA